MRQLSDSQLASFDTEYVDADRWRLVKANIDRDFPDGRFRFLDLGGGTGRFADLLLANYPLAEGCVFDNSELLLAKNKPDVRKQLICDSAEHLGQLEGRFDLVSVHWLLHHLVSDSYAQTTANQHGVLRGLAALLSERGRVSVYENNYQGLLIGALPGWLIYQATLLRSLATLTRRLGANTAGVGVCFRSERQWRAMIAATGFNIVDYGEPDQWIWPLRWYWRVFLFLRRVRVGHYWLAPRRSH